MYRVCTGEIVCLSVSVCLCVSVGLPAFLSACAYVCVSTCSKIMVSAVTGV